MKKFLVSIICSLILLGCTSPLQFSDPTQPIQINAGDEFQIVLNANPTTGYHWEFVEEVDQNIIQFVSRDYEADQPVTTGSGGTEVWTFKAIATGEARITLGYYSPSNELDPAQQNTIFIVTVK